MSHLTVNIDMVAALREIRGLAEPDPAHVAVLASLAGADGIAVQLRRNRRFVRDRDVYILKGIVKTKLTVEIPPVDELIETALEVKPWMVTFGADQVNGDGPISPIDLNVADIDFGDTVARFKAVGVHVGFFVEPKSDQIKGVSRAGGGAVLLDCSGYSNAQTVEQAQEELDRLDHAANAAAKAELAVHCGKGISYRNIRPLVELELVDEFVIGYAIASRALLVGYERAVLEMLQLVRGQVAK
ncbi:MAG: pyridoxine 5'-phosphate synthase [candidate division Zixibacteria bacterium]|nr:pyridoxine 5'-phosphate synthase [candidate division Zixibacteria bacterium]